jgi:hypothetical protein
MFNASIRGWINYYGCYYKSALYPTLRHIDRPGDEIPPGDSPQYLCSQSPRR